MIVLLNTHKPDRLFLKSNIDRPSPPINVIAYFLKSNSDRPSPPINVIAYFPNQTMIANHHP
ncbi:MAG: hypothetical protein IM537_17705 [Pseudanabaena sp. M57BS1SP1A06MG]|nr:hypothetical protein [Pseudanabaena sp. M53BS1SP1A06MG]MCA6583347.1 hypothetical protein [Pseudanabaena sp. M34BS1SP1A06MG]MCA6593881.1 hypothetical protein [Pseudanabaena sp. M38BS1SP1A06MG]MCA6601988.1 hypothetical protein [Pseudanabaena sp. M57BS1SP1A06MG]